MFISLGTEESVGGQRVLGCQQREDPRPHPGPAWQVAWDGVKDEENWRVRRRPCLPRSRGGGAGKEEMGVGRELGGCWERGVLMGSQRFGGNGLERGGRDLVTGGGAERSRASGF